MADPQARDLVRELLERGLSASAISRALGRDPKGGGISQIARDVRGPGYGQAFVSALQNLSQRVAGSRGQEAREIANSAAASQQLAPPRRTTATGSTAQVRGSVEAQRRARRAPWSTKGGRLVTWDRYELGRGKPTQAAAVRRRVRKAPRNQAVRIKLHGSTVGGAPGHFVLPDMPAGFLDDLIRNGAPDDPILAIDPADPPNRRGRRKRTTLDVLASIMDRANMAGLGRNYEVLGRVTGFEAWANEHTGMYDFDDEEDDEEVDEDDEDDELEEIAAQRWW